MYSWWLRKLKSADSEMRQRAAWKLGCSKDRRATKPLIGALSDECPDVRRTAAQALGWIADPVAGEALAGALQDPDQRVGEAAAEALGLLRSDTAIDALSGVLLQPAPFGVFVQAKAAEALGHVANPRVVEPLAAALDGRETAVLHAALEALAWVGDGRALAPLVQLAHDREHAARAVGALRHVLEYHAAEASPQELRAVAALKRVEQLYPIMDDDGNTAPAGIRLIDCADLRTLALRELDRRALAA
jgi:HEAT repeat protein